MTGFLEKLIADTFNADKHMPEQEALHLAKLAIETLEAVQVAPVEAVQRFEVEAKIYHLRGQGMRPCDLMIRFALKRTAIFEIIRRHGRRRRAALRLGTGMVA